MRNAVIQGYFVGAQAWVIRRPANMEAGSRPGATGARGPVPVQPARVASVAQARPAAVSMAPAQRSVPSAGNPGNGNSFQVNPAQIGIASGGGSPLPKVLLAKMEAAFRADFSSVRVHIGPQAARIGALAFAMGNDLYFSPGIYQPDSVRGQELIGHELAHVVQQRQGRVRAPGPGISVVLDKFLEAEADRLGMQAASHVMQRRSTGPAKSWQSGQSFAQGILQRSRAKKSADDDSDEEYLPSQKQVRGRFTTGKPAEVIKASAHQKKQANIDTTRFNNVWTCPVCARPLAYETVAGKFCLTEYAYVSKSGNNKKQRALEIDHHPTPWAKVLPTLGKNVNSAALNDAYNDEDNLRALCRLCNGSHNYEGVDVPGYDSDDSSGPGAPSTPKHEPLNKGQFSFYK